MPRCPTAWNGIASPEAIAVALKQAGYVQIGLDHFALPDDEMAAALREGRLRRNFQGYTTDESNILLGFGASAIGRLPQGYVQNAVGTRAYEQAIASDRLATVKGYGLTDDDRLRAEIIERIMCDFGVDLDPICARHGLPAEAILQSSSRLRDLISDGIVELDGTSLTLPDDFALSGAQRRGGLRRASRRISAVAQPGGLAAHRCGRPRSPTAGPATRLRREYPRPARTVCGARAARCAGARSRSARGFPSWRGCGSPCAAWCRSSGRCPGG